MSFRGLFLSFAAAASALTVAGASAIAQEAASQLPETGNIFRRVVLQLDEEGRAKLAERVEEVEAHGDLLEFTVQAEPTGLWLGVQLATEVPPALAHHLGETKGALVETVYPDSPAAEAKVEPYDLIVALGEREIDGPQSLIEAVKSTDGKPTPLVILRGGKKQKLNVTPRERTPATADATERLEMTLDESYFNIAPHVRILPALSGNTILLRSVATPHAALPPNVESVTITIDRNDDGDDKKVARKFVIVMNDGKVIETSDLNLENVPAEVRTALPYVLNDIQGNISYVSPDGMLQGGRLAIRVAPDAVVQAPPAVASLADPVPSAPRSTLVLPPGYAPPSKTAKPAKWIDLNVSRAEGKDASALESLKADVDSLKQAVARIEKLLQKDE